MRHRPSLPPSSFTAYGVLFYESLRARERGAFLVEFASSNPHSRDNMLHAILARWSAPLALAVLLQSANAENLPSLTLKKVSDGLSSPVGLIPHPDGKSLLLWDQVGLAYLLDAEGKRTAYLDLQSKMVKLTPNFDERGFLGAAFHPKFAENQRLFVCYSAPVRADAPKEFYDPKQEKTVPAKWNHTAHISELKVKDGKPDIASERVLLQLDEPQFNHNSGRLIFGPDGYLYISTGDGGDGNDYAPGHAAGGNGQDLNSLLGKVLRIDVDKGDPYGIPSDNPLVGQEGRPEIYAWGLRNPWGMSLDPDDPKKIILADVGQNRFEEINLIEKGGNYGWNTREGFSGFNPKKPGEKEIESPKTDKSGKAFLDPVVAYKNVGVFAQDADSKGSSVTGGYVYTGTAIPALKGKYVFGDWKRFANGCLFVADRGKTPWALSPLALRDYPDGRLTVFITAFGQDHQGELYVMTNGQGGPVGDKGVLWKLVPAN